MDNKIKDVLTKAQYIEIADVQDFYWHYPKHVPGQYIPQPNKTPSEYPCFIKQVSFWYNSNGADEYIIDILYPSDFK